MRKSIVRTFVLSLAAGIAATPAHANVVWNWSFAGEQGTFTTDGAAAGPGTFNLLDFSVTSSPFGRVPGSLSGGQYSASGFSTNLPYSFAYNGTAVTQWNHSGGNGFDWWVFTQAASPNLNHFFGWATGNVNDPTSAALYDSNTGQGTMGQLVGVVTVTAANAAVPEPATWAMLILGFGVVGATLRRRQQSTRVSFA